MDGPTKEDFERTIKIQAHRVEILEYEANILRAQLKIVRDILVEALVGKLPVSDRKLSLLAKLAAATKAMSEELDWDYKELLKEAEAVLWEEEDK
jgi:hypothetical protein